MVEFTLDSSEKIKRRMRYLIQTDYNGVADFYRHLYGNETHEGEIRRFEMFLKRGIVNVEFMDLLSQKTKIGEVSLRRLFDVNVDNDELFRN
ncbi:hypothetical protein KIH87_04380 [Paraneptunicella aestuarii]|uniref:hypothetical protein n=1 Tax=Paraneptunicella aestuarii TaxID=2831148 RepID=UPI001E4DDE95|nr:hypothetical protein [Paraneptunicella aestuarii]UAA39602.1 hypothetical protein KIH87_04380 [Paraneptunicella aestuarii]